MKKSHKNSQTSVEKTQTCEKKVTKKWQTTQKKVTNLWKRVTKSDNLVKKGRNVQDLQGTFKGPSEDPQGTNTKTDDLMEKLFFRSNSVCITYLFLLFTGRTIIQKL